MIGAILRKRVISYIGYILATLMIVIMFFAAMIEKGEDIFPFF